MRALDILRFLRFKSFYVIAFHVLMLLMKLGKLDQFGNSVRFPVSEVVSFPWATPTRRGPGT